MTKIHSSREIFLQSLAMKMFSIFDLETDVPDSAIVLDF